MQDDGPANRTMMPRVAGGQRCSRAQRRAHAACSRTSGSASSSARVSTSASSVVPTLPSTTAALRFMEGSLARFIGEPRNAARYASRSIPRISRASVRAFFPASASRGVNGKFSGSSLANRTFQGHTDWEICRETRFAIPLGTGARTLAKGRCK